jgi:hydroxymethylpyrimidine/phosphomethylpyrimidine kinase
MNAIDACSDGQDAPTDVMRLPIVLTVAGSDPVGGAGVQGDLRALAAAGVHGTSAFTTLIAQGTRGVRALWPLEPAQVRAQVEAVLDDVPVDAAKTGVLGTAAIAAEVAAVFEANPRVPLVVDPVLASSSGTTFLDDAGITVLLERLVPRATLVTPNAIELARLVGEPRQATTPDDLVAQAERLRALGARAVLAKGGHLPGDPVDVLVDDNGTQIFAGKRIASSCTRGTGCFLSAGIAAGLARRRPLVSAVATARGVLRAAITNAIPIGEGSSPVDPFASMRPR